MIYFPYLCAGQDIKGMTYFEFVKRFPGEDSLIYIMVAVKYKNSCMCAPSAGVSTRAYTTRGLAGGSFTAATAIQGFPS